MTTGKGVKFWPDEASNSEAPCSARGEFEKIYRVPDPSLASGYYYRIKISEVSGTNSICNTIWPNPGTYDYFLDFGELTFVRFRPNAN